MNGDIVHSKPLAIFQIILSAVLYGCLGYLGIMLVRHDFTVSNMLFWRFFIASLWMTPYLFKQKKPLQTIKLQGLTVSLGLLILYYTVGSYWYFIASQHIGTGHAMIIFFAYPLFVVLLAWFIEKQPPRIFMIASIITIIVGLVLLKGVDTINNLNIVGIAYGLLGAACYAAYVYTSQHQIKNLPSSVLTLLICVGCSLLFLIECLVHHHWVWPQSIKVWAYILGVGIIATALPIQLMLEGLKVIHASKASLLTVIEPLVTVLLGILLLNESFSYLQALGGVLILIGALAIQFE